MIVVASDRFLSTLPRSKERMARSYKNRTSDKRESDILNINSNRNDVVKK
jgi:hypothetical protein